MLLEGRLSAEAVLQLPDEVRNPPRLVGELPEWSDSSSVEDVYDDMNEEYEASVAAAEEVSERINAVDDVDELGIVRAGTRTARVVCVVSF